MGTKQAIINAAITLFGQRGFEGVGTREIAQAAGKQMSAISYHFGSKDGLYRASAIYIADGIRAVLQADNAAGDPRTPAQALDRILLRLEAMIALMTDPASEPWALFMIREQLEPTATFDLFAEHVFDPLIERSTTDVALCRPELDEAQVRALGATLIGMPIMLRTARAGLMRQMKVDRMDEAVEVLRETIFANARTLLAPPRHA